MAVFIPVAVLATSFLAEAVTAVPIVDPSYVNEQYELNDEKIAGLLTLLSKPGVKEGILGTFGAVAGGIGALLGVTGHKDKRSFEQLDDDKLASLIASLDSEDDEQKVAGLLTLLSKPGVKEGILGTFGAVAGGIGALLGVTGHKDKRSFDELDNDKLASLIASLDGVDDEEKVAGLLTLLSKPGVKEGILGTFGAVAGGIGALLGVTGHKDKRSFDDLADEEKIASIFAALTASGGEQKRGLNDFDNMSDEEKMASFWKYIPHIATAIGGVFGLGAGAYTHVQNGKQKRALEELSSLLDRNDLSDEEKMASLWKYVPAIATAIGGVFGLGAGAYQHVQNGKDKRAMHAQEIQQLFTWKGLKTLFGIKRRELEDAGLLARMIDDAEFWW
ncbi:hypothetical protein BJ508DRAFT_411077 [Ascobolus immersus RN42]|uniref:Uncharacterized protein n=1 Tax=Ascobolus immersus RN42 TaxID=1160509 RepID=A0A3N4IMJ7_ASCIM|nr:hypothetical protein BJ508DRAFT_411077 [Ascobolus immersus RN42]